MQARSEAHLKRAALRWCVALIACLTAALLVAGAAWGDSPGPVWQVTITALPTNLVANAAGRSQGFFVMVTNVGSVDAGGEITVTDHLPVGLSPSPPPSGCEAVGQLVSCTSDQVVHPGESLSEFIPVTVDLPIKGGSLENLVVVQGGGAETVAASVETQVGASAPGFGFLPGSSGLAALANEPDGAPATRAGSTPYQLTIGIGFPSELAATGPANAGHPRDLSVDIPSGFVIDPAATPRCRGGELVLGNCPPGSQVGTITVITAISSIALEGGGLYNIVPPPGSASDFAFESSATGTVFHLLGSIRTGDYGLSASVDDILARYPVLGIQLQLWGYPADPAHDAVRGGPVEPQPTPFIAMPSACGPLALSARADSWENPGAWISDSAPVGGIGGDPLEVEGCSRLEFEPAFSARPTTATADGAAGLDVKVEVPQHLDPDGLATSSLRHATVTLPTGTMINPAAAAGLVGCTAAEIGLATPVGQRDGRFDGAPADCPNASKLGTVEAETPLLQDKPGEGAPSPHPFSGSIYLAQPGQNPFGSLFALYAVVEDAETGIIVKLAGEVAADPVTGQLTATFDEIPQLPFEAFKLDFFGGPQAVLRTPALCGSYASHAAMMPWSGTAPVQEENRFSIVSAPSGGACATAPGGLPAAPRFDAGRVLNAAGHYSPFVVDLSRDDGSQELGAFEVTLPDGLVGRPAGSAECPGAALAAATAKSGGEEEADPSCPAASRLGRVVAKVGAGPGPYAIGGSVYLAGPYRGAPLSLAVVTPALAGPFDLGTVVVRAAVFVDPSTGRLTVKSDPWPQILDGAPLDVRSLHIELDKPGLIRNPTSCEPMAISGSATTTLGQVTPLSTRFQVGECAALTFRPKLSVRFSGAPGRNGHPGLRAVLRTDPEGAALKSARFSLPAGELLDLKHVRRLCPRAVAAGDCPPASRLGSLRLYSPLLEAPLEGPVYLRVPRHRLPDLVGDVHSEGFSFLLHGRTTDSRGRIGVALESLPDMPLSRAILTLAGGRRGILVNSHSLCRGIGAVTTSFAAHSGRHSRPRIRPRHPAACSVPRG